MKNEKHPEGILAHKYKKVRIGKDKTYIIFKCFHPNCDHYLRADLVEGKESVCWKCEGKFVLKARHLHMTKPNCGCGKKIHEEISDPSNKADEFLKRLLQ